MKDSLLFKLQNPPWNFGFWMALRSHKWQLLAWTTISYEDCENMFSGMPMKGEI